MIDVDEWNDRFDIIRISVLSMNEAKITQEWMQRVVDHLWMNAMFFTIERNLFYLFINSSDTWKCCQIQQRWLHDACIVFTMLQRRKYVVASRKNEFAIQRDAESWDARWLWSLCVKILSRSQYRTWQFSKSKAWWSCNTHLSQCVSLNSIKSTMNWWSQASNDQEVCLVESSIDLVSHNKRVNVATTSIASNITNVDRKQNSSKSFRWCSIFASSKKTCTHERFSINHYSLWSFKILDQNVLWTISWSNQMQMNFEIDKFFRDLISEAC